MLYDNALLAIAYLETLSGNKKQKIRRYCKRNLYLCAKRHDITGRWILQRRRRRFRRRRRKILHLVSTEIKEVLGESDGEKFCKYYNITEEGNFEGLNIPNLINSTIPDEDKEFVELCRKNSLTTEKKGCIPIRMTKS